MRLRRPEIFISAVSKDLRTARQRVRDEVLTLGCFPVVQEHFGANAGVIRDMIRRLLTPCDAVIHVAGLAYGFGPREGPPEAPPRSYTQFEFDLARELGRPLYLIVCAEDFPFDAHEPEEENLRALQQAHRQAILGGDALYVTVHDHGELASAIRGIREVAEAVKREVRRTRIAAAVALLLVCGCAVFAWSALSAEQKKIAHKQDQQLVVEKETRDLVLALSNQMVLGSGGGKDETPAQRYERALGEVALKHNLEAADLRRMIDDFITRTKTDPNAGELDRALAAFATGEYARAAEIAAKAADVAEARAGREARTIEGNARYQLVQYPAALTAYRRAAAGYDRSREPVEWAEAQSLVALLLLYQAAYDEADNLLEDIIAIRRKYLGENDPTLAVALNDRGMVLQYKGDLNGALACLREAERIDRMTFGDDHPHVAVEVSNRGIVLQAKGDLDGALACYREAERIYRAAFDDDHPNLANFVNNRGSVLLHKRDLEAALACFQEAERIDRAVFGDNHPSVARDLNNRGEVLRVKGNLDGALACFSEAERIGRAAFGGDHPKVAISVSNRGNVLRVKGDLDGALDCFREAERIDRTVFGADHSNVASDVNNRGSVLQDKGDLDGALACYREAFSIWLRKLGPRAGDTLTGAHNLASLKVDPVKLAAEIAGPEVAAEFARHYRERQQQAK